MDIERKAAELLGLDWTVELWTSDYVNAKISKRLPYLSHYFIIRRFYFLFQLKKSLMKYDVVVLRYMPLDLFSLLLSKRERRKIITIFHAKDTSFFGPSGFKENLLRRVNAQINRFILRGNLATAAVTKELLNYYSSVASNYKGSYVYPNGQLITKPEIKKLGSLSVTTSIIKIAFIATRFYRWNGLEELLESIERSVIDQPFQLILVGTLTEDQRQMINQSSADIIHFPLLADWELDALLQDVNVTLGAFNLHHVDLKEACTLKVRTSLGLGVPVYSGHIDTALPSDFPFYCVGPASVDHILDYVNSLKSPSKLEVAEKSFKLISKIDLLTKFHDQIINDAID